MSPSDRHFPILHLNFLAKNWLRGTPTWHVWGCILDRMSYSTKCSIQLFQTALKNSLTWPLTTGKSFFFMRKSERTWFSQNLLNSRFWALGFLIYTLSFAKFKKKQRDKFNESQSMFLPQVIANAVQVTLWLSITNRQSHNPSFAICQE